MLGIAARWIVAVMANQNIRIYGAVSELVGQTVCQILAVSKAEDAIAHILDRPAPYPALGASAALYSFPEDRYPFLVECVCLTPVHLGSYCGEVEMANVAKRDG